MRTIIYKCNGKTFKKYLDVIEYRKENGFRVTNTTTISKCVCLVDVTKSAIWDKLAKEV